MSSLGDRLPPEYASIFKHMEMVRMSEPEYEEGMTRGTQTAWIVGAIGALILVIVLVAGAPRPVPGDPYAECRGYLWSMNRDCKERVDNQRFEEASKILRSGGY